MTECAFPPPAPVLLEIAGDPSLRLPVRRIFCLGRNYADHVRELGGDPARTPPFFFSKPRDAVVLNGACIPYPGLTDDFQHEVELVLLIGRHGYRVAAERARQMIYGYAVGVDLTRRDLQFAAMDARRPWDSCKGFDRSAVIGPVTRAAAGVCIAQGAIWLDVNGERRQSSDLSDMLWTVPEIVACLSEQFELAPGDAVFTGTPAGVSALRPGDHVGAGIAQLSPVTFTIGERREGFMN